MNKLLSVLLGGALLVGAVMPAAGYGDSNCKGWQKKPHTPIENLAKQIPLIGYQNEAWEKTVDVAQFGDGDWSQVVGRAQHVTVKEAMEIAESHPEITYFFIIKSGHMVLGKKPNLRIFKHGEAVFFKGQPQWSEAKGMADGYVKKTVTAN